MVWQGSAGNRRPYADQQSISWQTLRFGPRPLQFPVTLFSGLKFRIGDDPNLKKWESFAGVSEDLIPLSYAVSHEVVDLRPG